MSENEFAELMRRLRAGDEQVARDLVDKYAPLVRIQVRRRLEDRRLRRVVDSLDVCQSAFGSFFVRTSQGEYDLNDSEHLLRLLIVIARNKVASAARRERSGKRDQRRQVADSQVLRAATDSEPTASQVVARQEMVDRVRDLLSVEEQRLASLRCEGHSWQEIADLLGGTAQARRVQFSRAIERIRQQVDDGAK